MSPSALQLTMKVRVVQALKRWNGGASGTGADALEPMTREIGWVGSDKTLGEPTGHESFIKDATLASHSERQYKNASAVTARLCIAIVN